MRRFLHHDVQDADGCLVNVSGYRTGPSGSLAKSSAQQNLQITPVSQTETGRVWAPPQPRGSASAADLATVTDSPLGRARHGIPEFSLHASQVSCLSAPSQPLVVPLVSCAQPEWPRWQVAYSRLVEPRTPGPPGCCIRCIRSQSQHELAHAGIYRRRDRLSKESTKPFVASL